MIFIFIMLIILSILMLMDKRMKRVLMCFYWKMNETQPIQLLQYIIIIWLTGDFFCFKPGLLIGKGWLSICDYFCFQYLLTLFLRYQTVILTLHEISHIHNYNPSLYFSMVRTYFRFCVWVVGHLIIILYAHKTCTCMIAHTHRTLRRHRGDQIRDP